MPYRNDAQRGDIWLTKAVSLRNQINSITKIDVHFQNQYLSEGSWEPLYDRSTSVAGLENGAQRGK